MTVDAHMHVGNFPLFNVGLDRDGLVEVIRHHELDAAIVFHPDNAYVREIVNDIPEAYALVWANPHTEECADEVAAYLEHPKFLGGKFHPLLDSYHPNDPIVYPVVQLFVERDLPILIHCGHPIFTLPWSIEELIMTFPDAKVILGHMGHGNIVYINGAIDVAARHPNVYLETSGMPMHTKIREAVIRVGEDRVLYGSDAPFHHPSVEMLKVKVSGLEPQLIERVLDENARALFFSDKIARRENE